jgi:SPX domain protein involved in polyphosphate accumulation
LIRPKSDLRYELKYLLRREQVDALVAELRATLTLDPHSNALGTYPITSLYYDTPDYKAYWDKLDGHRSRRKVRVRVYGDMTITPDTPAFLEIKQRINKMMRKRRAPLPYHDATDFDRYDALAAAAVSEVAGEVVGEVAGKGAQISGAQAKAALLQEAYYLYRTLQLRPACVVTYDRMAFEGDARAPDLRITIDTNLRGRIHDLSLLSTGSATDVQVLGAEYAVLEVKANQNVPRWVAQLTARHRCTFYRISKYCMALERTHAVANRQHLTIGPPAAPTSPA